MVEPEIQAGIRDKKGRFVKGQTGNPLGRPPSEFSVSDMLRAKLADRPHVMERLLTLCESEDENVALKALIAVANRLDGMPKQAVENTGKGGGPISLTWSDESQA